MKFRVNQDVASPLKITVRDEWGNLMDLAGYTSASVDVIDPYGTTTVVNATKSGSVVSVYLPPLTMAGEWELYLGLWKNNKVDYSQRIGFEVE